jgi:uncharacterized protein YbjT (DUF2867 family)
MADKKVLVLCATGKAGKGIVQGLVQRGYEVYGTTRSAKSGAVLEKLGAKPIVANYVIGADVQRAVKESGAKQMVFITDFFGAAKSKMAVEEQQGKTIIDAAKASGIAFTVFISVHDIEPYAKHRPKALHIQPKGKVEAYLRASGLAHAILRPVAFFENLDDPANWNPLKAGGIKFLTAAPTLYISTFDLGKAAAACLADQAAWNGKTLECASWKGDVKEVAAALQAVSGVKCSGGLAMPTFFRWLFLHDLDQMCRYIEAGYPDGKVSIDEFKAVVPDALDAQGWFRHHGVYADGKPIVKT